MEEWTKYHNMVYTEGEPTGEQHKQLRMAFFGGARAAKHVMMRDLSPGDDYTESDLDILRDMQEELKQFALDVKAGRA